MKEIVINSKMYGRHVAIVDDEDFDIVSEFKWHLTKGVTTFYAQTNLRYTGAKTIKMHVLLLGRKRGQIIDHKDGNGLNNTRGNIRVCESRENARNRNKRRNSKSQYKGVCWLESRNRWIAHIFIDKKLKRIGSFKLEHDAAKAYNDAARKYFGEFARLNQVPCVG